MCFLTIREHVSYASKKLLIKQRTSLTWCVLHGKDYGWFLIKLSIFDFSGKFHRSSRTCNYFQFLNYHRACSLCIRKDPNQAKDLINMVRVTLEVDLSIFDFLSNFTGPELQNNFQAKDLINMVCVTLEGLWMVSDRIINFRFFVKFHRSGTCNIFQLLNYSGTHKESKNRFFSIYKLIIV